MYQNAVNKTHDKIHLHHSLCKRRNRIISFYEKAFGFKSKFIAPGTGYGEMSTGETTLAFASVDTAKTNLSEGFKESTADGKPLGIEIGFTTENVDQVFKDAVKAGAIEVEKAKTKPWGQTVAYVKTLMVSWLKYVLRYPNG